jgi:hypothetical protein
MCAYFVFFFARMGRPDARWSIAGVARLLDSVIYSDRKSFAIYHST